MRNAFFLSLSEEHLSPRRKKKNICAKITILGHFCIDGCNKMLLSKNSVSCLGNITTHIVNQLSMCLVSQSSLYDRIITTRFSVMFNISFMTNLI